MNAVAKHLAALSKVLPLLLALAAAPGAAAAPPAPTDPTALAEQLYAAARPKLLQIRTLLTAADRQSSIGSGFLVSADGLAITNYHVVSQVALEPATYHLEYAAADGDHGTLQLVAIDLADDLALVRLDHGGHGRPFFAFDDRAVTGSLPKGERLFSLGNPLDLGFTIVEGTYNGPVERSYAERIHFSGAINPGMSGGPALTEEGRIAGVNVAKQRGGELISFLVPARFASALVARARSEGAPPPASFHDEIARQLTAWQAQLYRALGAAGFRADAFGPYEAPESAAPWFTCWGQTNAGQVPQPRASVNTTACNSDTWLFVASDLETGFIRLAHSYVSSRDLNRFQFAAFLSKMSQPGWVGGWSRKWFTQHRCRDDFVAPNAAGPPLRVVWCARANRQFPGLYDAWVLSVTQDSGRRALVSRLALHGVSYDNAVALTRRFLDGITWKKP